MADAGLAPYPKFRSMLADGITPNAGGLVYFYAAGTSTPKPTQVSRTGANNLNPVVLDPAGEADVWYVEGFYKVVENTALDVPIRETDDVSAQGDLPTLWTESSGNVYRNTGNVFIGATTGGQTLTVAGTASVSSTLGVSGLATFNAGLVTAGGNLVVNANDDLILSSTSDITVNTDKLTVEGSTGNTSIAGTITGLSGMTLESATSAGNRLTFSQTTGGFTGTINQGASTFNIAAVGAQAISMETNGGERLQIDGTGLVLTSGSDLTLPSGSDILVNTDKFTVAGSSGNTVVGGTLTVDGSATVTGNLDITANSQVTGTLGSTGLITGSNGMTLEASTTVGNTLTFSQTTGGFTSTINQGSATLNINAVGVQATSFTTNGVERFRTDATGIVMATGNDLILPSGSDITVNTNSFTVEGSTGNTVVGGTLTAGTTSTFTGVATFTAQPIVSSLNASEAVFTDGSKGLVSNPVTGTGDIIRSVGPALTGTATLIDANISGNLGIGGNRSLGVCHVVSGDSTAASTNADADELVLENNGNCGMQIFTPDNSTSSIFMGTPSTLIGSSIQWDDNNDLMEIGTSKSTGEIRFKTGAAIERVRIDDAGNTGMGTTTPNASALLHMSSTTKAFMPPQMTTTQRDAISGPIEGMYIHNTTTNVLNFHNGTSWGAV